MNLSKPCPKCGRVRINSEPLHCLCGYEFTKGYQDILAEGQKWVDAHGKRLTSDGLEATGKAILYRLQHNGKSQMTREEAIKKLNKVGEVHPYNFIDSLETLGLIKFEEKPKQQLSAEQVLFNAGLTCDYVIKVLDQAGYKIVRKDAS